MSWVNLKTINVAKVNKMLKDCTKLNKFTNGGPNVDKLENFIRHKFEIADSKAIVCVANGTMALWCLCCAIEMTIHTSVTWCTQSFTFPSSAQGLLKNTTIVDIDRNGGLDLNCVPNKCNGIIVTNVFGNVVDIDTYEKWAHDNNKILIFDNAATPYTFYKGLNSCNYGSGSIISFHHTKPFGFGEGGAIILNKVFEENARNLINFGLNNKRCNLNPLGANYKMSDIAAVYIIQYIDDNFDRIVKHHINMYNKYKYKYKMYPNFGDSDRSVLSCFCLFDSKYTKSFIDCLIKQGIMCRKYYVPLANTPIATEFYDKILCHPLNLEIESLDI